MNRPFLTYPLNFQQSLRCIPYTAGNMLRFHASFSAFVSLMRSPSILSYIAQQPPKTKELNKRLTEMYTATGKHFSLCCKRSGCYLHFLYEVCGPNGSTSYFSMRIADPQPSRIRTFVLLFSPQ